MCTPMIQARIVKILVGPIALVIAFGVAWAATGGRSDPAAAQTVASAGYVAVSPNRILDTRSQAEPFVDLPITVQTGLGGVSAVAVNVTVTQAAAAGFTTAWASGPLPGTSSSNFAPGADIANFIVVPVSPQGTFLLQTSAPSELIVDIMGYFTTAGTIAVGGNVSAAITGYSPGSTVTSVVGTATNARSRGR